MQRTASSLLTMSLTLVIALYVIHFVLFGFYIGPYDYDHLSSYYELAWRYWASSHHLPHFNPYFCGGRSLGADPQIPIFHPLVILVPVMGATSLIKLEMLGQLALGTWGLFKLLKNMGCPRENVLWGMLLFISGGGIVCRFMVGHVTLGFFFLFPLFVYLSYELAKCSGKRQHKLACLTLLLFTYAGLYKPNFLIYGVPLLAVEHFSRAWLTKNIRVAGWFIAGILCCILVNASAYLPAWHYFTHFPRTYDAGIKHSPWVAFVANLLFPLKAVPEPLYGNVFMQRHEYSIFLGPVGLFFAALAIKRNFHWHQAIPFILMALFSFGLGLGATEEGLSIFTPFSWLYSWWPGFHSIRVPVRFWFAAYFVLVLFSAKGFSPPASRVHWVLLLGLGILPLLANVSINLFKTTLLAAQKQSSIPRLYPHELLWAEGHPDNMYSYIRKGQGVLACQDNLESHRSSKVEQGPFLRTNIIGPAHVDARLLDWNEIAVSATNAQHSTIRFNFNHSPQWIFRGQGATISSVLGEPLTLTASNKMIEGHLVYEQPYLKEGVAITMCSILAIGVGLLGWGYTMRRRV
ncbi:MAG: hypothetical protein HY537_06340 [Deltaproteobacteria bacterium]|nr:hypothetical protein [Deltaproteobacteria bacterium]